MKSAFYFLLVFTLVPLQMAHAFKGARCARLFDAPNYMGRAEQSIMKMFYASTSTSQFFTSTGKCKMLGGISESERKVFVAHNSELIKKDIIRANGDYLSTMTFLYGCSSANNDQAALRLQENVNKIFGPELNYAPVRVSEELDKFMHSDANIRQICSDANA